MSIGASITMLTLVDQGLNDRWADWISQVARGDESALASFYEASSRLVYGLAFRLLGDASAAQEVTLDVYMQVWRRAKRFDSARGRVSTWLMVMARSRAIDRLRVRPRDHTQIDSLEAAAETRSETPGPEETIKTRIRHGILKLQRQLQPAEEEWQLKRMRRKTH